MSRCLAPEAEAGLVVGMLRGVAFQWITDPGCFDPEAVATGMKRAIRCHPAA